MRRIGVIFNKIINLTAIISGILLIFMMLSICYGVAMRYFLKSPSIWVPEVASYCILYITFLSAAWLMVREKHVVMDIVVNRLKPGVQNSIDVITSIICSLAFLTFTIYGVKVTWDLYRRGIYPALSVLGTPSAYVTVVIPIASFLLFIVLARRAWRKGTRKLTNLVREAHKVGMVDSTHTDS